MLLAGCGAKDKTNDKIASTSGGNTEISISGATNMTGSNDASYTDYRMKDFDPDKLSEKYIIGIAGYPSYGDYYECLGYSYIVTYEKELIYRISGDGAGRFTIDDATFDDFIDKLDFNYIANTKIYVPDSDNICDGGSDYISMLDKMDPEVAKKALEQFPEFANTTKKMLKEYKESLDKGLESNNESVYTERRIVDENTTYDELTEW